MRELVEDFITITPFLFSILVSDPGSEYEAKEATVFRQFLDKKITDAEKKQLSQFSQNFSKFVEKTNPLNHLENYFIRPDSKGFTRVQLNSVIIYKSAICGMEGKFGARFDGLAQGKTGNLEMFLVCNPLAYEFLKNNIKSLFSIAKKFETFSPQTKQKFSTIKFDTSCPHGSRFIKPFFNDYLNDLIKIVDATKNAIDSHINNKSWGSQLFSKLPLEDDFDTLKSRIYDSKNKIEGQLNPQQFGDGSELSIVSGALSALNHHINDFNSTVQSHINRKKSHFSREKNHFSRGQKTAIYGNAAEKLSALSQDVSRIKDGAIIIKKINTPPPPKATFKKG